MAKDDLDRTKSGILGDINPTPAAKDRVGGSAADDESLENEESMAGGSKHDETEHSGSRDVTEGTSGGLSPETGGTSNYRTGSGATGTEVGYRPETKRYRP